MLQRRSYKILKSCIKYSTAAPNHEDRETHFGFQTIKEKDKVEKVYKLFESVASNYDKMNDALSMGVHRLWKDIFMCRLAPTKNTKLLDMAGGTGDISFRFLNYIKNEKIEKSCHVTICDINRGMLDVGKARSKALNHDPALLTWKQENAETLSFDDNTFNAYTIAFGIRNCTRIDKVLEEAYRVLTPGGRFLCLEFSKVENEPMKWLYDQYSMQIIPVMGHLIAGEYKAYEYLVQSIRQFPNQETFKGMIEEAGFREVTYENLTFGMVAIHSGFKL